MSVELPFAILRYDPSLPEENEWTVRKEIQKLATRISNTTGKKVHILSMSEMFWRSINESEGIEAIIELEKERGFLAAERQVNAYLDDDQEEQWRTIKSLLIEQTNILDPKKDIVFLTRATAFAPSSYRVSALLEKIINKVKVPIVLFYPGTWQTSLNYMGLRSDEEPLGSYRVKIYGRD
jgi:hypothetical protein